MLAAHYFILYVRACLADASVYGTCCLVAVHLTENLITVWLPHAASRQTSVRGVPSYFSFT